MLAAIAAAALANGCADDSEDKQFTTHVVGCEGAWTSRACRGLYNSLFAVEIAVEVLQPNAQGWP